MRDQIFNLLKILRLIKTYPPDNSDFLLRGSLERQ